MRSFAPAAAFPSKMHSIWMMLQMIRWGQLHPEADVTGIADQCVNTLPFRTAADSLHITCPAEDAPAMELRRGRVLSLATIKSEIASILQARNSLPRSDKIESPRRSTQRLMDRTFP
jgi:hypothetical protein